MNFFCKRSLLIALPAEIFSPLVVRLRSLRKIKKLATTQNISYILLSLVLIGSEDALAAGLPTGGKVEAGQVSIAQTTTTMNVTQTTQRAVVSWNSFDVAKGNTVNFVQPNASAVTLNRVNGVTPSMINGAINANGQVIFVNPNGVVFGKGSEVNVGGMVSTTMNVSNADFMAGKDQLTFSGGDTGKVVNKGRITVSDAKGFVALMAPEVRNEGVILANISGANSIALVSGKQVTLTFADRQMISISIDASVVNSLITNKRLIQVNGGQVVIAANAANNLMSSVVTNKGTVAADGVNVQGGVVTLTAGAVTQAGTVSANSSVTASVVASNSTSVASTSSANSNSPTNAGVGGKVTITGDLVTLASSSKTTATGTFGGGTILLGVNAVDRNQSTITAKTVTAAAGSVVDVSATQAGNGGLISVWSSQLTSLAGQLLAKGGQLAGNGGSIQTGSLGSLSLAGTLTVDTSAIAGSVGNWTIASAGLTFDATSAPVISNALLNSNVTIQAGINIPVDINNSQFGRVLFLAGADINNQNPFTNLYINSQNSVEVNGNINSNNTNIQSMIIQINPDGSLGNNGNGPSHLFLAGAAINILGSINGSPKNQNGNNQLLGYSSKAGGTIWIIAADNIYIGPKASITANGDSGGLIHLVSTQGSVTIENALIQTNGSTGRGGTIEISGLLSTNLVSANVQAQGNTVGGIIKIGNDAQYGTLPFSLYTSIDANSTVTAFAVNGPGGYIETSGHTLHLLSAINAGRGGIWLLDPTDIIISNDPDGSYTVTSNYNNIYTSTTDTLLTDTTGSTPSYINVNILTAALNSGQSITVSTVGSTGAGNGDITVSAPINAYDGSLTLDAYRNVNINAPITLSGQSSQLYVTGTLIKIGADISTTANQIYSAPVLITKSLNGNSQTNLTTTNGGLIFFGSTVDDGDAAGTNSLVLSTAYYSSSAPGTVVFFDSVGRSNPLGSITVNAEAMQATGYISTVGSQTYNVNNFLLGDDVFISTVNSPVSFGRINDTTGGHSLTVNSGTSSVTFNDAIGDQAPIKDLTVYAGNISLTQDVVTDGNQSYIGPVSINGNIKFFTPSIVYFGSTIDDSVAGQDSLAIHAGGIGLGGNIGSTNPFAALNFDGPVRLFAPVAISTTNGPISFTSTIDDAPNVAPGSYGLTVSAGSGTITLGDSIGYNNLLGAIEFDSPVVLSKTSSSSVPFTTIDSQYCSLGSCLYVITNNSPITFSSSFDDASTLADGHNVILSASGSNVNLFSPVGLLNPLRGLEIYGTANLASSISSVGNQTYHNSVLLMDAVTMTTSSGDVHFMANVQGNGASVIPSSLIQFLGNGSYIYNGVTYIADATAGDNLQVATVTFDSNTNIYQWTPSYSDVVKVLAVGGGGAGGGAGGGGGGGGVVYNQRINLVQGAAYQIAVGSGGFFDPNGWPGSQGSNGANSIFGNSIVALGGGGGGGCCWGQGNNGGSGGGAAVYWYNWGWITQGTSGLGSLGQGNAGAAATTVNGQYQMGGGGGGAGSSPLIPYNGQNVSSPASGNGGSGLSNSITGSAVYYGGGGGAAPYYDWGSYPGSVTTTGGVGGGGAGGYITGNPGDQGNSANWVAGVAGLANTGGGGGAGPIVCCWNGPGAGSGGSGTVIIARPTYGQAVDLTIKSGKAIIGIENISNINNLSLSSSSASNTPVVVPLSLISTTTSFTKGGTDTYVVNGLTDYSHTITVTGGTLSVLAPSGSTSPVLNIDSLVLNGGSLALDISNPQALTVNNLSTYSNSPITNAKTVNVSGSAYLGSSISSVGDQYYANDVTLWSDTTLTSSTGNIVFGGKVLGYVSTVQFLGNGQYLFQDPSGSSTSGTTNSFASLPGGFVLSYNSTTDQYGFVSSFSGQAQALVVAGGGAGANGGGGGGGVIFNPATYLVSGTNYLVIVGNGGIRPNDWGLPGGNGGNSQFGNLIAIGGGGGGSLYGPNYQGCCWMPGVAGGSGGGGSFWNWNQGGAGTPGQGFSGGQTTIAPNPNGQYWLSGGGGGAGGSPINVGGNYPSTADTGNGGIGYRSNITGAAVYYGGGGGGSTNDWQNPGTTGGLGGGGNGGYNTGPNPVSGPQSTWINPTVGAQNTGGGGGGGWWGFPSQGTQNGGSGIVVLNIGIAPNLTINAQPSAAYPNILQGTNFSHIGILTVNTSGNFSLNAAGQIASSAGLVKMGSGTLTLNNIGTYAGSISVAGGTIVTPGLTGPLTMGSLYLANGGTFDLGSVGGQDLNLGTFTMVNGGNLLHINNLNVSGQANLSGAIATSGAQTYGGAVQLTSDVTIQTANTNPITFNSTIDGPYSLSLNSGYSSSTGMVNLNGVVGGAQKLSSLTINGPSSLGGTINTTGNQIYNGDVRLTNDTLMNAVTGNIQINGNVLGDAFYPGIIQFLGGGDYAYQTLGVNNNLAYTVYHAGGAAPSGVVVSYDPVTLTYVWTANYNSTIQALLVAGGGGGGIGGGGGGGVLYASSIPVVANQTYSIVVGAGGSPLSGQNGHNNALPGTNGGNTSFGDLVAIGGGAGGALYNAAGTNCCWMPGSAGGSGGGGSIDWNRQGGLGTPGQGNAGGGSTYVYTSPWCNNGCYVYWQAGGGGGAGGSPSYTPVANNPWNNNTAVTSASGGNGGPGLASTITGTLAYYGGGGGGGKDGGWTGPGVTPGASPGGIGGGGNGGYGVNGNWQAGPATSGAPNTGGGGGGAVWWGGPDAGAGGSGVAILSVPVPHGRASLYLSAEAGSANISGAVSHINVFGYKVNSSSSTIAISQISDVLGIVKDGSGALSITGVGSFGQNISILAGTLNLVGLNAPIAMNNLLLPHGATLSISNSTGFTVNGSSSIGGDVSSDNGQTYVGAVTVTGNATFTAANGSYVLFQSPVTDANFNSSNLGADSVTITGNLNASNIGSPTLNGGITQKGINSLSVTGASYLSGDVTTANAQTFNSIRLFGDIVLKNYAGNIDFSTVTQSGNHTLTLDTPSDKTINFSQISGISGFIKSGLNAVTINGVGDYSSGSLTVNGGTLNLHQSSPTIALNNLIVGSSILGTGATLDLDASGPVNLNVGGIFTLDLNSSITNLNNLTVAGNAVLRSNLTTLGNQSYNSTDLTQSVRVGANLVLTTQNGNMYFAGGVSEYNVQTNYLQLLGNGDFAYALAGVLTSGNAGATPISIGGLQMGISYANGQYNITNSTLNAVSVFIVAGGGGGGIGGGGGGGVNQVSTLLLPSTSYVAIVGAGGAALSGQNGHSPYVMGSNGSNSSFGNLIAIGGGAGGAYQDAAGNCPNSCWQPGAAGGSGGGGSIDWNRQGGLGTSGQGNNGGGSTLVWTYDASNNFQCCYAYWQAGGGGGAGGSPVVPTTATWPGQTGNNNPWNQPTVVSTGTAGNGGPGLASYITGTLTYYGGGGGGGKDGGWMGPNSTPGSALGGIGGGGNGGYGVNGNWQAGPATSGAPNTGGGGGGAVWWGGVDAGAGGSGTVIVRQLSSLTINVGLNGSSGALTTASTGSYAIGSLIVNSNSNYSLSANQLANTKLFTKGGSGTLSLNDITASNAGSVALIINGGTVLANHPGYSSLAMNSLTINNGSTFDLSSPGAVDLSINSLFMNSNAHLLGLNSLVVNQLASLSGAISTPGPQTYSGEIYLTGDASLRTTGVNSPLMVSATINDSQAGLSNLTLTVDNPSSISSVRTTLNGSIGSKQAIGSLTLNGLATIGSSISTNGNQTYNGDLTLTNLSGVLNDVSMTSVSGNITFNGSVTGYRNTILTFLGAGNYQINGATYNTVTNPAIGISLSYDPTSGSYSWINPDTGAVQMLVVAGGGAGGTGGGGGGGVIASSYTLSAQTYSVVVGNGGVAPSNQAYPGGDGGNSQFGALTAIGGGGGGSTCNASGTNCSWYNNNGNAGGSGGGGSFYGSNNNGGSGTASQGNAGGQGVTVRNDSNGYQYWQAGGGGGAGASPQYASDAQYLGNLYIAGSGSIGNGGVGVSSSITGSLTYYGAGGGGGKDSQQNAPNSWPGASFGGNGGGGNGGYYNGSSWIAATPGIANTGGGGGGTYWCCSNGIYSAGGSGIVILNGTLASFSRANLNLSTDSGLIIFGSGAGLNNIGTLSISTNRMTGQNLFKGVTNANTTSLVKGGSGVLTIDGFADYIHPIIVNSGTLSLINSPHNALSIETLVLNGGGLSLDAAHPQDLTVNNLTTVTGPINNANSITVTGSAYLGSAITSLGDQHYNNDVILWGDTTLTSINGNVIFGGKVTGYSANLQFLGNGQYVLNNGGTASVNGSGSTNLGGGLSLSYSNGQYSFGTQFNGLGQILLVGGGGGGGIGGGGGGGVLYLPTLTLASGSKYSVIVGAGGSPESNSNNYYPGTNGGNSSFGSLVAVGGGAGDAPYNQAHTQCCWNIGSAGGSGGGAGINWTSTVNPTGAAGTPGQGNNGGSSAYVYADPWCGNGCYGYWQAGGGGGAGASPAAIVPAAVNPWGWPTNVVAYSNPGSGSNGNGGAGIASSITGTLTYYGGGGGGGKDGGVIGYDSVKSQYIYPSASIGGIGGGGNGAFGVNGNWQLGPATSGAANTGGGGGGAIWWGGPSAGAGGSGIIVVQIQNNPSLTLNVLNGNNTPIGTSTKFVSLGELTVNTNTNFSLDSARLSGTQGFMKGGTGTLTLTNPNQYSGYIGVSNGQILAPDDGTHTVTLSGLKVLGGIFQLGGPAPQNLILGGLIVPGDASLINVANMTVNGSANLGGTISTQGSQTYNGPVEITSDVTILTQSNNPITFNSTIDGAHNLTLYAPNTILGSTTLAGNVGTVSPLLSLTVNSPSSLGTGLNGGIVYVPMSSVINTTGNQTYNGNVRLVGDMQLNTVTGNIVINGNVTGDKTHGAPLQFLGGGNYSYQGINYVAGSGVVPPGPNSIIVTYDSNTDSYTWVAPYTATVSALIVGGGGAGGVGGGGGGGVAYYAGVAVNNGQGYTVIVGAGGVPNANNQGYSGSQGGNSQFGNLVAVGGGAGVSPYDALNNSCCWKPLAVNNGGSGGGGGNDWSGIYASPTSSNGGAGTQGQGYAGGSSSWIYQYPWCGNGCYAYWQAGGGGGAGGSPPAVVTTNNSNNYNGPNGWPTNQVIYGTTGAGTNGNGGPGLASTISGTLTYYGGGGGGGKDGGQISCGPQGCTYPGSSPGGIGGGGSGAYNTGWNPAPGLGQYWWISATAGAPNTGGGGGGNIWCCFDNSRSSGGSGVVILSLPILHGTADLSMNSGTGQYFINGTLSNINTLSLGSNSTGITAGSTGFQWSNHAVTVDASILSGVQNFTKNGVDNITLTNLRPNFGQITVNTGNLYLPTNATINNNQFSFTGVSVASGAKLYLNDLTDLNIGDNGLSLASSGHLYLNNVGNLNVSGSTFLANNLDITGNQNQTYGGLVTLGANILLSAGNSISFNSTVDSAIAGSYGLEVNAPAGITFNGAIGGVKPLSYLYLDSAAQLPATINTVGDQVYASAITLNPWANSNTTTLTASGANSSIYLLGSVDSTAGQLASLTLNAPKASYVAGNIGQNQQIDSFTVNSGKIYLFADVYTGYSQTYNGNTFIGGGTDMPFVAANMTSDNVPVNLIPTANGVNNSFLASKYSADFNYIALGKSSHITSRGAGYIRTLVSTDPVITFNGTVDDQDSGVHSLVVGAISENGSYPLISINGCIGCISKLYSVNMQAKYRNDTNNFGLIYFNQNQIKTISDQVYRTYDPGDKQPWGFWSSAFHQGSTYQPIQDAPPGRMTVISYVKFTPGNYGFISGSTPGSGVVLSTSRITLSNLSAQQTVLNNGAPIAQSTFSGGNGFSAPSSGSSSGGGSSSGSSTGGGSSSGSSSSSGSGGSSSGSSSNGSGSSNAGAGSSGSNSSSSSSSSGSSSSSSSSTSASGSTSSSSSSSGGSTIPPVKVVEANAPAPTKSGSSLGGISLGGLMASLGSSKANDSLPSLAGDRAPLGIAVVDVGGIEIDDPSVDMKKKK
ncbi:filamentous hemagglutinin N-terminal domain-containing protein [Polynucleobacter paneuropaeus]|nr:filamentous hemagglutinin N-terminal domain-containing protein [Polynucleobacter paneuropaeus]